MITGLALVLASCVLRLAPAYDADLVAGLREANTQALQLFAAASHGGGFAARRDRYDDVIGRFDAMKIEAEARPVPTNAAVSGIAQRASSTSGDPRNPTPIAIANIIQLLTEMRTTDQRNALSKLKLDLFKNLYTDEMKTVFRNENALNRK